MPVSIDLSGRTALVTGASRGIGRAVAVRLAEAGADVSLVATNEVKLAETAKECGAHGVRTLIHSADVTDGPLCNAVVEKTEAEMGGVDILVNNAGVTRDGVFIRMDDEAFDEVMAVNFMGAVHFCRAAGRLMLKARSGSIINVASVIGMIGNAGQSNYAASKGAVIALTRSLAREFAARGVRVNAVAPGYVVTDMTDAMSDEAKDAVQGMIPLGTLASPERVADGVLYLASDLASYVTGQVLPVDGGMVMD